MTAEEIYDEIENECTPPDHHKKSYPAIVLTPNRNDFKVDRIEFDSESEIMFIYCE